MTSDEVPEERDDPADLRPPSIPGLDQFVVIGAGGFSTVWRAWQAEFNRPVAVKVLFPHHGGAQRRFERECFTAGSVGHPNIVYIYRAGRTKDADAPFLEMEYLPRGSMAQRLERNGPMSWERTMEIGVKLSGALATAHLHDVLHRDVKPENVLMTSFGEPKLADFGIARMVGQSLTTTTLFAGTPEHAPPELVRLWYGPQGVQEPGTDRADVYSLASTLFTLLMARAPFTRDGDTLYSLSRRILEEPVPDLRQHGIPTELCGILERGMAKRPEDRYASALELGTALREAQMALKVAPTFLPFEDGDMDTGPVKAQPAVPTPTVPPAPEPAPPDPPRVEVPESPEYRPPDDDPLPSPRRREPVAGPGPDVPGPRRKRLAVAVVAAAVLTLSGIGASLILRPPPLHTVPNVEGQPEAEAKRALEALNFRPAVRREPNDSDVAAGLVAKQVPVMARLRERNTVRLIVSDGPTVRPVPDLTGRTGQEAVDALVNAGFKPGRTSTRDDPRVPAGQVLDWTRKGTSAPIGATVDLTISTPAPPPKTLPLVNGPLSAGQYNTTAFSPRVALTATDGWIVEDADSPDLVVLARADRTSNKVSIARVQRVYDPASPHVAQQQISTTEDALNSVQDVRELPNGLAGWLSGHTRRAGGGASIVDTTRGGRTGKQVDARFRSSNYEGCAAPDQCIPLFQLYGNDGQTRTFAKVASEVTRFEVFDLISGVKLVVATSALEGDFPAFVDQARALLNVDQFDFTERISTPRVRSSVNPSNENEPVSLTAEVNGPCSTGKVVFTVNSAQERKPLGSADVVNGRATIDGVTFQGRGGRARVVGEYDGPDCAKGISAPLVQAVQ